MFHFLSFIFPGLVVKNDNSKFKSRHCKDFMVSKELDFTRIFLYYSSACTFRIAVLFLKNVISGILVVSSCYSAVVHFYLKPKHI